MLSSAQKQSFRENGFLQLPGFIPSEHIDSAVQTINHRLGQGFPSEELATRSAQTFFPDLSDSPLMLDLFNESGLIPTLEELMGKGNVARRNHCQLALRFPRPVGHEPKMPGPHIDGIPTATNGVAAGTLGSFTALAGIFLTDVPREFAGNFVVWPGSHLRMEEFFQNGGLEKLLTGERPPTFSDIEPLQIQAKAGDVVLAHYQLSHGVVPNVAPFPRYALFFRLHAPNHKERREEVLKNLWLEWPGMQ